jgi:hypothetical protein
MRSVAEWAMVCGFPKPRSGEIFIETDDRSISFAVGEMPAIRQPRKDRKDKGASLSINISCLTALSAGKNLIAPLAENKKFRPCKQTLSCSPAGECRSPADKENQ